jgi:predicted SnoaL-like aldol condensation-catalyzing enzyme
LRILFDIKLNGEENNMKTIKVIVFIMAVMLITEIASTQKGEAGMELDSNKEKAVAVLNSLETRDRSAALTYISDEAYIQHNLGAGDGIEGFLILFEIPDVEFKVNVVRVFEDGDFVFVHTVYDFFGPKVGFDVFRFEDGKMVEHWDNLQDVAPQTVSGRSQVDGPSEATELDRTEENKKLVEGLVNDVFLGKNPARITDYISTEKYDQHNPGVADGLDGLGAALEGLAKAGMPMTYSKCHRILGEGNFVLVQSEGTFMKKHVAFYDLFRVENGKIVEHWDTIEEIPARENWRNGNGKF